MFGIGSTTSLEAQKNQNARRRLTWENPTGVAPLMAFMSMIDSEDETSQPKWDFFETRYKSPRSITVIANAAGPFINTDGTDFADGGTGIVAAAAAILTIVVDDAEEFRTRDIVWLKGLTVASGNTHRRAIITAIDPDADTIKVRTLESWTGVRNTTANNGIHVVSIGSATPEGDRSNAGGMTYPVELYNQTQITRTSIGPWTRNALKMGAKWDKTGVYRKAAKEGQLRHMLMMELAFLFGDYRTDSVRTKDGHLMPERKMGGFLWYLKQWDKGNTANGGLFEYRPGGTDLTSVAWRDYPEKRHIDLAGANITLEEWYELMRRAFMFNSSTGWEKLVLCDSLFLHRFNEAARANSLITRTVNNRDTTYGMSITSYESENGVLHFKTSPVFNESPLFSNSGMIIDLGTATYMSYQDTDTELLANRQPNDADYRLDEWMTECGLELNFPERCMWIENLGKIIG